VQGQHDTPYWRAAPPIVESFSTDSDEPVSVGKIHECPNRVRA